MESKNKLAGRTYSKSKSFSSRIVRPRAYVGIENEIKEQRVAESTNQ